MSKQRRDANCVGFPVNRRQIYIQHDAQFPTKKKPALVAIATSINFPSSAWPVSSYRHLDFCLQPAAGLASTSRVAPTCRMDSVGALRSHSSCCCRVFYCFRVVSNTNTQNTAFRPPIRKLVTFWAVSITYPVQLNCTDSCDRGPGGISSEDFPS